MIKELKENNFFYNEYEIINFINTTENEKTLILQWRNNENVRKWMVNKDIISLDEHCKYIESLRHNDKKLCFLIKNNHNYLGVVEFDLIDLKNNSAYFGLSANMDNKRPGVGTVLQEICLYISKDKLKIKNLLLYVFSNNKNAISLYEKFGFKTIKEDFIYNEKIFFMEKIL
ncbi:UDP-4-amino-4,6-dideoxy-N-acetyl-beta-L-altrosamine N-acetyltransferase [Sulfurospirillum diekertiae]|uniref:UDP-4-amino-4, 6-dideoxy-N-acetyl-beta-L-altrosamine N-acetyltransferase n=1 Tax=Sulfurospirillum diekertiae TaxID=1854492 RepID=A0A6G9VQZ8_9BACT|nr:UDP-4-amino-4,6-dideoxy-N-acetyl-beta-L-altrosamine N-acetyltransferase [Sulfurospirillum diekertiae]QIR75953.1 UDP-4-amino-4,6-dideoxy-N-acetyl-beta-L-altrosamine N-acetyltransferase [Sulfurospirillum diekertiae]QIR78595.1 UDP-4-amino-4,6-dideoxy-N-acetyl-beta-L-altrosamine N-acetyltransferase [Sulfurospirillum diekertiae]